MEIDIDSVDDIFLFLTIVIRMMAPFEIPEIKRKEPFTSAVTSFFVLLLEKVLQR